MPVLENGSHELFSQHMHETGNKSEAYRLTFPEKAKKWKDETIHKRASEMSLLREVQGRVKELKEESAAKHSITIESLLNELDEARLAALGAETVQSSAAVSATMSKAKLVGLDINRVITTELSHEDWLDSLK